MLTPLWLIARLERHLGREGWFAGCSELLSLIPSMPGIYARRAFYCMALDQCSSDVHIGFATTLAHPQVRIGRGVYVGSRSTIGKCSIGDDATVGSNVDLLSGRRQHEVGDVCLPMQQQRRAFTRLHIGRNCWIGNSAVIMNDVGDHAIVGAGSVVVHPIPALAVAVGNPAGVVRRRAAA